MTQEQQNSVAQGHERIAGNGSKPVTADELTCLYDVLAAAREYIAAVKQQEKGGVGKAWARLVKATHACEEE
jgi:hypothetical protein